MAAIPVPPEQVVDVDGSSAVSAVTGRTWFGHPRGMFLVAITEMWERFSYWGLAGLLVLFLTAAPATGGWGWDGAQALKLYGWYAGMAFVLPVVGAWLANNLLSERRCILAGGVIIVLGHLLLAGSSFGPEAVRLATGVDAQRILLESGVSRGHAFADAALLEQLRLATGAHADSGATWSLLRLAYSLETWSFLLGLGLILIGTGLMKPTISSIVAHLYPEGGSRRDEGFSYFFVAIYIGALFGAVVVGYLGERVGWHYGFGAAAVGMTLGLACYLAKQRAWLGDLGSSVPARRQTRQPLLSRLEKERIFVIGVQGLFTVFYAVGFYQMFGMLNLYARDRLDRSIGSFEVPTTWLQTINLWSFFVCVPALAWSWRRLAQRRRNPSASYKLALGIGALAVGYLILVVGESSSKELPPGVIWLIATYALFGLGDALVWANQISLTSKLAPVRYRTMLVGGWYICIGIGTWLTGYVGALMGQYPMRDIFLGLAIACGAAALTLVVLTPTLQRYMHGAEHLDEP